jgi:nucleoid-associated protein YgaU
MYFALLPGKEELSMWKTLQKTLNSPDSYVSLALGFAVVLVVGMIAFNYFRAKTQPAAQTAQTQEATAVALPAKHAVKEGETLWSIAETYYKNGYNWVDVAKANNLTDADQIEKGQELTIPAVTPSITPTGTVSSAMTEKQDYTVKAGDSLWSIAVAQYQDGYRWPEIARANNLTNPGVIHAGNVLMLP